MLPKPVPAPPVLSGMEKASGLIQYHTGDSLTTYLGTSDDTSHTGLGQERLQRDYSKNAYLKQYGGGRCAAMKKLGDSCYNWINPDAFSIPINTGAGTGFGNIVKGSLRGPNYTIWDAALVRTFPIFRETKLDFRAEYFNLLNHTVLDNPTVSNPASSNTAFGNIKKTGHDPRIAQFSLKYAF
jgi:hypothetical protein